jgi:hypothetical protein
LPLLDPDRGDPGEGGGLDPAHPAFERALAAPVAPITRARGASRTARRERTSTTTSSPRALPIATGGTPAPTLLSRF